MCRASVGKGVAGTREAKRYDLSVQMSLVVAHCSTRGIKAVSDTRLFDPISRLPCSHFDGTLKIFVLSERLG
jgi:hypothetical protein